MNSHTGTQREIRNHVLKGKTLIKRFKFQDEVKKNFKENFVVESVFFLFFASLVSLTQIGELARRLPWVRFVIHQSLATAVVQIVPLSILTLLPDEDLRYAVESLPSITAPG